MSASFDFSGKRVLVTGAGKSIGRAIAIAFSKAGATIVAISRTRKDLESLRDEIEKCEIIAADLADTDACVNAAKQAGDIDIVINNAGIALLDPFLTTSIDDFDAVMSVNLRQVFIISQTIAQRMVANGVKGVFVNVSSQASKIALANHTAYCTSKAALNQLTQVMALELAPHGIRTNAIAPTVVLTEMGRRAWGDERKAAPMLARIPMGRFLQVDEVVGAILFLASDSASMINGTLMPIDGGFLASPFRLLKD